MYIEVNKIRDKFNKLCNPKFILDKYVQRFVKKKIVATMDETTNNKREEIIIIDYLTLVTKLKDLLNNSTKP